RHTRFSRDWSSDVCSSDLASADEARQALNRGHPAVLVLTGAVHEPASHALAERARELEVSVLALLEATDSERTVAATRLGATEEIGRASRRERGETEDATV